MKKIIIGVLIFIVGLLAVFAAINFKDEPLDVAVAETLNKRFENTPEQIKAHKYALGITAPLNESVENVGEMRYNKILERIDNPNAKVSDLESIHKFSPPELPVGICDNVCTKQEVIDHAKDIASYLASVKTYIERVNTLLTFKGFTNTIPPAMANSTPSFAALGLVRMKTLELQYKAYIEKDKFIDNDLQALQKYFLNSFNYADSLLATIINSVMLLEVRNLYTELKKEPFYKNLQLPATPIDIENVVRGALYFELNGANDAMKWDLKFLTLDSKDDEPIARAPWYQTFLLQKNRTLNSYHRHLLKGITARCKSDTDCGSTEYYSPKWYEYVQNPVGKLYNKVFYITDNNFAKLFQRLQKFNADLETVATK
jgi:hypothetical protein